MNRKVWLAAGAAMALVLALPASADNRSCESLLAELERWPAGTESYQLALRQSMSPRIVDRLDGVATKRKVSRTLGRKIADLYYDVLVSTCRQAPSTMTHMASEQAAAETRSLVEAYFELRE